jgi:gas vesicle protein
MPYIDSEPPKKSKSIAPAITAAMNNKGGFTVTVGVGAIAALLAGMGVNHVQTRDPATELKFQRLEESVQDLKTESKDVKKEVSEVKTEVVKIQSNQKHMAEQIQEIKVIVQNPYHRRPRRDPNND